MPGPEGRKEKKEKKKGKTGYKVETRSSKRRRTEVEGLEKSIQEIGFVPPIEESEDSVEELTQPFGEQGARAFHFSVSTPTTLASPAAASTPKAMSEVENQVKALQDQLQKALAEIDKLNSAAQDHDSKIRTLQDTTQAEATPSPAKSTTSSDKNQLPLKYDGTTNLASYLVQFETLAKEQGWPVEKQGIVLLGRLKGRALDVATQGTSHTYPELVERLKTHFSPDNEDMFAQQLHATQKKSSQTWEDLAFQIRELTRKAYGSANEATRERLAVGAYINAIPDDQLRQKLRDSAMKTIEEVLQRVRKLEADQAIEKQRGSTKKSVNAVQDEDERVRYRGI